MLHGFESNHENNMKGFEQRISEEGLRSIEDRQDEIQHAKNGFIGMLAGIIVGGIVGWLFLGPVGSADKEKEIPVVRRALTPAKVQPNDPGGMEIDNQNREIYHIVDNLPKEKKEVNIVPAPEMPKLIVENKVIAPDNMETLVDRISDDNSTNSKAIVLKEETIEKAKIADTNLIGTKTNSREKIIIPEKIKDIEIKLQKSINSKITKQEPTDIKAEKAAENPPVVQQAPQPQSIKGTWYAQIIASSSRKAVENLWSNLSQKHVFLKNYSHEIEEIKVAGNTLYRLKVGSFKTRKDAEDLSTKLKQNQISSIIKQN